MSEEFDSLKYLVETLSGKTMRLGSPHYINFPIGWKDLILRIVKFGADLPIEIRSASRNDYEQLQIETEFRDAEELENDVLFQYINFLKFCKQTELMSLSICIKCGSVIGKRTPSSNNVMNGVCTKCNKISKGVKTGTWLDDY